jgi:hypothetical protein
MLSSLVGKWAMPTCLAVVLLGLGGCDSGPRTVTATGSVLRGGQPLPLSKTGVVQVTLIPDVGPDEQYTPYVGRCDVAGKFEVLEVPPGRYKIGIEQLDPTPQDDKLRGQYAYANAKYKREVDGKAPIVIDLAKPE